MSASSKKQPGKIVYRGALNADVLYSILNDRPGLRSYAEARDGWPPIDWVHAMAAIILALEKEIADLKGSDSWARDEGDRVLKRWLRFDGS